MKRILIAFALTCVLSVSALAGTIPTCGITSEAPREEMSSVESGLAAILAAFLSAF